MIQRCFALPYYVYCLRLCCLVSFLFYSTIKGRLQNPILQTAFGMRMFKKVCLPAKSDRANPNNCSVRWCDVPFFRF
ncbi:Uncharacterised protein [Neisseria animalis]|nr:Uncharacterised protein [Neisseria animalis]